MLTTPEMPPVPQIVREPLGVSVRVADMAIEVRGFLPEDTAKILAGFYAAVAERQARAIEATALLNATPGKPQ